VVFQDRLKVGFVEAGGRLFVLDCPAVPSPWHLLLGLLRLQSIPVGDKLKLRALWGEIRKGNGSGLCADETVEQWLIRLGQGERSRALFWDPLTVAALNERPEKACAVGLRRVLQTMMSEPWPSSRLGMASVGLSDLYAEQARRIIEERAGRVLLNRSVARLEVGGGQVQSVRISDGSRIEAQVVISAVPPSSLQRILPDPAAAGEKLVRSLERFRVSPILSVNLWFDRLLTEDLFVAMIGCRFQWFFNTAAILRQTGIEATYVSLILSAAYGFIDRPNGELVQVALEDLQRCFPKVRTARLIRSQVIREREATLSLTVEAEKLRPGPRTALGNLFLAGDWTATGLPATIESAVVSGERAAKAVLSAPSLKLASAGLGG